MSSVVRRGFTLVEAMMAVAIIGVLASIAAVSMSGTILSARLRADSEGVDDILRKARNLARLERRCVQAVTTANRLTTTPIDHSPNPPPPDCGGGRLQSERRAVLEFPRGLRMSAASFLFDRSGGVILGDDTPAREGGGVEIIVTIADGAKSPRTFRVGVLAGSGAVVRRQ